MPSIDAIVSKMYSTRNRLLVWVGIIWLTSLIGLIFTWHWLALPQNVFIGAIALLSFLFIAGFYLLLLAGTILHPTKHPIIRHLQHEKHQIVWVYSFISINMPFGVQLFRLVTIWLHYRDGSQQYLRIEYKYLKECMQCLQNELPHATFGYSVKNEQLYRANPVLLERE
jgi:hypothetical protein